VRTAIRFGPLAGSGGLAEGLDPGKVFVLADEYTARFIPPELDACPRRALPRGEAAKTWAEVGRAYEAFAEAGVGRDWTVVAIGGGCVSDLAGFAASTWMRGVELRVAPTTLLAMADAALGGKNGINLAGRKNLVGSFLEPELLQVDVSSLASLSDEELASGLVECVKHAIIDGEEHLSLLEGALGSGIRPSALAASPSIKAIVRASMAVKSRIVEADPKEAGPRMALNLGHTIGHAAEAATGLSHGACVAAGLACALRLAGVLAPPAYRPGLAELDRRVASLLRSIGMPTGLSELREAAARGAGGAGPVSDEDAFREAVAGALVSDKKKRGGDILFALPFALGDLRVEPVALEAIRAFIRSCP
jgi:3-dehydroquinate synthetase